MATKRFKIQQGDYGIVVWTTHDAKAPVFYTVDGGDPMPELTDETTGNTYFVVGSGPDDPVVNTLGDHTYKFYEEGPGIRVDSFDEFVVTVVAKV